MNDVTEMPSTAAVDDIRARNKELIFAALAEAGIDRVTVEYDGSGDSGQIDDVWAWNAGDEIISFPSDRKITLALRKPGSSPRRAELRSGGRNPRLALSRTET